MNIKRTLTGIVSCVIATVMMAASSYAESNMTNSLQPLEENVYRHVPETTVEVNSTSYSGYGSSGSFFHHGDYGVYYKTEKEFIDDFYIHDERYYEYETDINDYCKLKDGVLYSYDEDNNSYVVDRYVLKGSTVTIPKKINERFVTAIGENAFLNCKTIKTVKLPETLKYIGKSAFEGCTKLTNINFPNNLQKMSADFENTNEEYKMPSDENVGSFYGCTSLKQVKLNKNVTDISYAFMNCTGLQSVELNKELETFPYAFYNCTSLSSVKFPKGISFIDENSFMGCKSLKSVSIPGTVTEISVSAFEDCKGLTKVTLAKGVGNINGGAFCGCTKLTSINIPGSVYGIGPYAFGNCKSLKTVKLNKGTVNIYPATFINCTSLTSINLPDSLEYLGFPYFEKDEFTDTYYYYGGAFHNCTALKKITVPDKNFSDAMLYAFTECKNLKVTYKGVTRPAYKNGMMIDVYGNVLDCLDSAKKANIPNNTPWISDTVFYNCNSLTSVTIGSNITELPAGMFNGLKKLKTVKIGKGLGTIESSVFANCPSLTSVNIPNGIKHIEKDVFTGSKNVKIKYDGITYEYGDIDYLMELLPSWSRGHGIGG